nr:ergothioneine biosynthesis protein 1 [Quercus suber]
MCPSRPEQYAAHPLPDLDDWHQLWTAWDIVTQQMIPTSELMSKPIKLRNPCLFYLGHIPAFFDMKIVEATGGKPTEPSYFYKIFERGIDPDVDDPDQCHAHSELPDEWPSLETILMYQERVRDRLTGMYRSGQVYNEPWTGRAVWLGYEHEALHLETLLYMLLQSEKTLPPAGTIKPDFEQLAIRAKRDAVENEWFDIPAQTIEMGLDDPDNADGPLRHFGWDIEKPARAVKVSNLKVKARPITNEEYARYLVATGAAGLPVSWASTNQNIQAVDTNGHSAEKAFSTFVKDISVKTVYGLVPLNLALHWPMSASYDELAGCAKYMGGRIPTVEESRSIYVYADMLRKKLAANALGKKIPAVNGNEGVQESPPQHHTVDGQASAAAGIDPNQLFVNLEEANVGFKHWHPMPVTQNGGRLSGQAEMGGLWEWTSTPLAKPEKFEAMKLYPAYSGELDHYQHTLQTAD